MSFFPEGFAQSLVPLVPARSLLPNSASQQQSNDTATSTTTNFETSNETFEYRLIYFNVAGLGELIRTAFAVGRIDFEDVRLDEGKWKTYQSEAPYGQLPVLEMYGTSSGKQSVGESQAIARYVGKLAGLVPRDAVATLYMDSVLDSVRDVQRELSRTVYGITDENEKRTAREELVVSVYPTYLRTWSSMLQLNGVGTDWLNANTKPTLADIAVAQHLDTAKDLDYMGDFLRPYPRLRAHMQRLKSWVDTAKRR